MNDEWRCMNVIVTYYSQFLNMILLKDNSLFLFLECSYLFVVLVGVKSYLFTPVDFQVLTLLFVFKTIKTYCSHFTTQKPQICTSFHETMFRLNYLPLILLNAMKIILEQFYAPKNETNTNNSFRK